MKPSPAAPPVAESPPHNPEAEQALLGGMLLAAAEGDIEAIAATVERIGSDAFYPQRHRLIWGAIERLHRAGRVPDIVAVTDALREETKLDEAGGAAYISGLLQATFSPITLPQNMAILARNQGKRALLGLGGYLLGHAGNGQHLEALVSLTGRVLDDVRELAGFDSSTIGEKNQKNHRATAAELLEAPEPSRPWWPFLQREGVLGPGVVGLLSGYAKSGKTTTTAHGLNAILQACPDLRVIWCTEEARSLWRARLLRWRFDWPTVTFVFRSATPWASQVAEISQERHDVLIIDTARAFLGIVDENDAGQWRSALDPLLLMARQHDSAVLLLHHLRKSGGDDGLGHAGNHALVAAVDVALELRRDGSRRTVRAISRYDETPPAWVMELRDDRLTILGDPETVTQADLLSRLVAALDDTPRTAGEIAADQNDPKPSTSAVYAGLKELHRQGRAERSGKGTRSHPYRWTHKEKASSSSTPLRVEERTNAVEHGARG